MTSPDSTPTAPTLATAPSLQSSIESLTLALQSCYSSLETINEVLNQTASLNQICNLLGGGSSGGQSIGGIGVNPDISGIGVSISFLIQGVFFVLFGPLLGVVFLVMPKRQGRGVRQHLKRLKDLSTIIRGTSAFLSFSTLLAGCIHLRQSPGPLETLYIVHLADYLGNMALGGLYISWSLKMGPLAKVPLNTVYLLCELTNTMLGDYLNNAARRELIPSLARQQMQLQPILAALQAESSTPDKSSPSTYEEIVSTWISNGPISWVMWPIAMGLALLLSFFIFVVGISDRPLLGLRNMPDILPLLRRLFNKNTAALFVLAMNILTLTLVLHGGWELWDARTKMNAVSGSSDNNAWGFGQITAVLLWAPTTFWIVRNFLRLVPWMDVILYVAKKFSSSDEDSSIMTLIVVAYLCAGITVELDRIDPLIKEPGEGFRRAEEMEDRDEGFPDRRHQVRDEEDRPALEPSRDHEDIEMSGALQSRDADEGARESSETSRFGAVGMARDVQSPTNCREGNDMLQISREPVQRIIRRHSN